MEGVLETHGAVIFAVVIGMRNLRFTCRTLAKLSWLSKSSTAKCSSCYFFWSFTFHCFLLRLFSLSLFENFFSLLGSFFNLSFDLSLIFGVLDKLQTSFLFINLSESFEFLDCGFWIGSIIGHELDHIKERLNDNIFHQLVGVLSSCFD